MNYPPAPWYLKGYAIQTLHLLDIESSRHLIPPELEIVSVLPGKTLGGIYLSIYQSGSVLEYSELIVVAGLTRYQNQFGFWISHIYVDNEISVAGGREIWQLPKEMAEFTWKEGEIEVKQQDITLCRLNYNQDWYSLSTWWQPQLQANAFSGLERDLLLFKNSFSGNLQLLSGKLFIPETSYFSQLNSGNPLLIAKTNKLDLQAGKPEKIANKSNFISV